MHSGRGGSWNGKNPEKEGRRALARSVSIGRIVSKAQAQTQIYQEILDAEGMLQDYLTKLEEKSQSRMMHKRRSSKETPVCRLLLLEVWALKFLPGEHPVNEQKDEGKSQVFALEESWQCVLCEETTSTSSQMNSVGTSSAMAAVQTLWQPRCREEERRRMKPSNELCRYKLCDGCCAKQLAKTVANTMWARVNGDKTTE